MKTKVKKQEQINEKIDNLKFKLALIISNDYKKSGITINEYAKRIGTTQPKCSNIINMKLQSTSLTLLLKYVMASGKNVNINIGE